MQVSHKLREFLSPVKSYGQWRTWKWSEKLPQNSNVSWILSLGNQLSIRIFSNGTKLRVSRNNIESYWSFCFFGLEFEFLFVFESWEENDLLLFLVLPLSFVSLEFLDFLSQFDYVFLWSKNLYHHFNAPRMENAANFTIWVEQKANWTTWKKKKPREAPRSETRWYS